MGTTFGFSAFLKLVSMNQRPRVTEMRKRLAPSTGSGYDFHKLTRSLLHRLLAMGISVDQLVEETEQIRNPHERKSAVAALRKAVELRSSFSGPFFDLPELTYESPAGAFKIKLQPDFGAFVAGNRLGVHVWNTKEPTLDPRLARAALSLFGHRFEDVSDDMAVLDLRISTLIRMGDPERHRVLADRMVGYLEETFLDLRSGRYVGPSAEDRLRP